MVYPAHVVHVLIASPSDVAKERKALREAIWRIRWEDDEGQHEHVQTLLF